MNAREKAQLQREHGISVAVVCGYCGEEVVEAIEILDAMPGEPELACEPCLEKHRPMQRPLVCSNCGASDHDYLDEDDDGLWDEDCRYHPRRNDDGSLRAKVRR